MFLFLGVSILDKIITYVPANHVLPHYSVHVVLAQPKDTMYIDSQG